MSSYSVAFDVGGLFTKAAVLDNSNQVCEDTTSIFPSNAQDDRETLLNHFVDMVRQQVAKIMDKFVVVTGIGYAFPGPFDYENGICYTQGVQKFDALYGVNLHDEIRNRVLGTRELAAKFAPDFQVVFDNDANLFALGEQLSGKASKYTRVICLTIGTGAGSAFLDRGELITTRPDVPENGWLFQDAFRTSIVDDFISKRGILQIARELELDPDLDVKDIAVLARRGNLAASEVFLRFGETLGEMLLPYLSRFRPGAVVIGGQIAKSHDLFMPGLVRTNADKLTQVEFADDSSHSTFVGVASLLQRRGVKA